MDTEKIRGSKMQKNSFRALGKLFWIFLKAGTFTFGGGLAMLPVLQRDIVDHYKLMDADAFVEAAALSQSLPGVIAVNCACFVGYSQLGLAGAIVAGLGAVIPAFLAILLAALLLKNMPQNTFVNNLFKGVRVASSALILSSAFSLGKSAVKDIFGWFLAIAAFACIVFFEFSAFYVIVAAGFSGLAYSYSRRISKKNAQKK